VVKPLLKGSCSLVGSSGLANSNAADNPFLVCVLKRSGRRQRGAIPDLELKKMGWKRPAKKGIPPYLVARSGIAVGEIEALKDFREVHAATQGDSRSSGGPSS
jgi:hypothetical protein